MSRSWIGPQMAAEALPFDATARAAARFSLL
jgi:hypothetical protein